MRDPYAELGLSRSATEDEIRRAFRRAARESHPDVRPGDATAAERFRRASEAYDLLRDPGRRRRFDAGDAAAAPRDPAPPEPPAGEPADPAKPARGFSAFSDIFEDLFGTGPARGEDRRYTLEIGFVEAVLGASRRVTPPGGEGFDLRIPPATVSGDVLRVPGRGATGKGGAPAGDALVALTVRDDPRFEREGEDIASELDIGIDEAVLGTKVPLETVDGTVMLSLPKGAASGQVLRLRGKGVPLPEGGRGDHLVTLRIVPPPAGDAELERALAAWRKRSGWSPRGD